MSILACGGDHWIGLTERGGLLVRGENSEGQLGIGTRNSKWHPTVLGGIGTVVGDEVGEVVGGVNALALLAATKAQAAALPRGVLAHPFDDKAAMVSAGEEHTMCVTDGGVVYAWGSNHQGQLGVNNTTQQAQALGVLMHRSTAPLRWSEHLCNRSPARMVACGDYHTLVLTQAGEVFACGRGRHGETGNSLLPDIVRFPERVPGLHAMALVAAGDMFSGAVGVDGQVWMWGNCRHGRLGYPPAMPQTRTAPDPRSLGLAAFGSSPVVLLNLRTNRAAAVTEMGELWAWGNNTCGKLGLGDDTLRVIPTLVTDGKMPAWGGSQVYMVCCGFQHQLVLTEDGAVWTCGEGTFGALGLSDLLDRWVPTRIMPAAFGGAKIVCVAGGSDISFAVTAQGILYIWGTDSFAAGMLRPAPLALPSPVEGSLVPGGRVGQSCNLSRRHKLSFCMGAHPRLGAPPPLPHELPQSGAPHRDLQDEMLEAILVHCVRLDGDYANMGNGLLHLLAVRVREN